ncbi:hypothetical protein J2X08_003326 [Rhizobium rosettiformans]|nr:hypothetical protein [Rhizobium rosettiformans]MDR7065812.1 hypothetical protein [Rhizobium rosettiformans]
MAGSLQASIAMEVDQSRPLVNRNTPWRDHMRASAAA